VSTNSVFTIMTDHLNWIILSCAVEVETTMLAFYMKSSLLDAAFTYSNTLQVCCLPRLLHTLKCGSTHIKLKTEPDRSYLHPIIEAYNGLVSHYTYTYN
jgi:hypothetical protein